MFLSASSFSPVYSFQNDRSITGPPCHLPQCRRYDIVSPRRKGKKQMFHTVTYDGTREEQYGTVIRQLEALIEDEPNAIANLANASALLAQFLADINWAGFYLLDEQGLVLGPFQGLPACVRIPVGRGVCGTAAERKETMLVPDVHAFPGHIACDAASQSEIVVPLLTADGRLIGVLDIDSPILNRFDDIDRVQLERFAAVLSARLG
ncbi:Protein YtsP [Paenibacillus sp. P22]|nr:Protein YtsP [Paenibacillus sp. P22]